MVGTILAADLRAHLHAENRVVHVPFCDNYASDIKAKGFGEVSHSELAFLPDVVESLHVRCPWYLEPKKRREMPEGSLLMLMVALEQ